MKGLKIWKDLMFEFQSNIQRCLIHIQVSWSFVIGRNRLRLKYRSRMPLLCSADERRKTVRSFLFHLGFRFQSVPVVSFLTWFLSVEYNLLYKWMLQKNKSGIRIVAYFVILRLLSATVRNLEMKGVPVIFCLCVSACVPQFVSVR